MVQSTAEVLKERGTRYGQFINQAGIAQGIHMMIRHGMKVTGKTEADFYVDELEAINMIVNKLARIINGDPHYSDSWRDIAGYSTLVADRLDAESVKQLEMAEKANEIIDGSQDATEQSDQEEVPNPEHRI